MACIDKQLHGVGEAEGPILLAPKPDFSRGKQAADRVYTLAHRQKSATIEIDGQAVVRVEGCNGTPSDENDWHTIVEVEETSRWFDIDLWAFVRFNVIVLTSGAVTINAAFQDS